MPVFRNCGRAQRIWRRLGFGFRVKPARENLAITVKIILKYDRLIHPKEDVLAKLMVKAYKAGIVYT